MNILININQSVIIAIRIAFSHIFVFILIRDCYIVYIHILNQIENILRLDSAS